MDKNFIEKLLTYSCGNNGREKHIKFAGFEMCRETKYDDYLFESWWNSDNINLQIGACLLARDKSKYLPMKYAEKILGPPQRVDTQYGRIILEKAYVPKTDLFNAFSTDLFDIYYSPSVIRQCIETGPMSSTLLNRYLCGEGDYNKWYYKYAGLYAASMEAYRSATSYAFLLPFTNHNVPEIRDAAVAAIRGYNLGARQIEEFYEKCKNTDGKISWMRIAKGRKDVHLKLDPSKMSPQELPEIIGLEIDQDVVEKWDNTDLENAAAIYWSIDHPYWNKDDYVDEILLPDSTASIVLKNAAIMQLQNRQDFYPYRTFEPGLVYKKCVGGVIIEAEIPPYAEVRGNPEKGRCRANEAIITDIIGDLFGTDLAISLDDYKTIYKIGALHGFGQSFTSDLSDLGSTGFHFYNSLEEARKALY